MTGWCSCGDSYKKTQNQLQTHYVHYEGRKERGQIGGRFLLTTVHRTLSILNTFHIEYQSNYNTL